MAYPEYIFGSDLKLKLAFIINGQRVKPDTVPFDIRVWTFYPSQAKMASYDGENWINCKMVEDYLEVFFNAPQFTAGRLNADITLHYPDDDMPDLTLDKICKVRLDNPLVNPKTNDLIITGEISDTITGLSAYSAAVNNGFEGTEVEWLQSLKQPAIDAAAEAEALMEDFAAQELTRANEENTRKQSDLARVAEEQNRVNQELARANEENTRKQSELARVAEEQDRVNQELARANDENTRKQSELARVAEEQNRVNQELARANEENTRKQSELARVAEEQNRVNQELARTNEENTRKQSELARVAEEQNRVNQELARTDEENTRKSQEIARQNTIAGLGDSFDAKMDKNNPYYPVIPFTERVVADGGKIRNPTFILDLYKAHHNLLPNTKLLLVPECGVKTDTTDGSTTISKLYDLSSNNNDAIQSTKVNQPFLGGFIAPNEKYNINNITVNNSISYTPFSFASTDNWSMVLSLRNNKVNNTSIYLSANAYLKIYPNAITLYSSVGAVIFTTTIAKKYNLNHTIIINYKAGLPELYIDGVSLAVSSVVAGAITFDKFAVTTEYINGKVSYVSVFDKALEAKEIQDLNAFLTTSFPDIETIPVGYQQIATSNFEGVVNNIGDVIPEVQANTLGVELVNNGTFDTDTIWINGLGVTISGGTLNSNGTHISYIATQSTGINFYRKVYKIVYTVTNYTSGYIRLNLGGNNYTPTRTANGTYTEYLLVTNSNANTYIYLSGSSFIGSVDLVSVKEVGWDNSTEVYNYYKTTLAQSEYESCLAASMWSYYNNDILKGAVYGKLYNTYARYVLDYYAPEGYRFLTNDDIHQLTNSLGGEDVASGKMKLQGLDYWGTPNTSATNESGLTMLGAGYRDIEGTFKSEKVRYPLVGNSICRTVQYNTNSFLTSTIGFVVGRGYGLRLIKNSPYGDTNTELTTGYFTTNIASGTANKDLTIPFGYRVVSGSVH